MTNVLFNGVRAVGGPRGQAAVRFSARAPNGPGRTASDEQTVQTKYTPKGKNIPNRALHSYPPRELPSHDKEKHRIINFRRHQIGRDEGVCVACAISREAAETM